MQPVVCSTSVQKWMILLLAPADFGYGIAMQLLPSIDYNLSFVFKLFLLLVTFAKVVKTNNVSSDKKN